MIFWLVFGALYVTFWAVYIFARTVVLLIILLVVLAASLMSSLILVATGQYKRRTS